MNQGEAWEKRLRELAARELEVMYALYAEQPARLLGDHRLDPSNTSGTSGTSDASGSDSTGSSGYTFSVTYPADFSGSNPSGAREEQS